jgi:hypothetical protein
MMSTRPGSAATVKRVKPTLSAFSGASIVPSLSPVADKIAGCPPR